MAFVLILILLMLTGDLLWWRWAYRKLPPRNWRRAIGLFMSIQLGCLLLVISGRLFSARTDNLLPKIVLTNVFLWHFILLPIALLTMLFDGIARVVRALRTRAPRAPTSDTKPDAKLDPSGLGSASDQPDAPSRRDFLRTATIIAPPALTLLTSSVAIAQLDNFRIRQFDLTLPQLPPELEGLTVAHVSDIHVGSFTTGPVLLKIVEAVNNLRADLVLYTGDLINFAMSDLSNGLDLVKRMDGRFGTYLCEGNHDLMENRLGFERTVKQSGLPLLLDESTTINIRGRAVQLLGLTWSRGDAGIAQSMNVLTPQLQPEAFPILLAHHPHAFDQAAIAKIPLTLSGHTHGGQIMPTSNFGFGPFMFRYWSGLYERDNSKLVVSNGVGNWFPLRINAPAEVAKITLHRG